MVSVRWEKPICASPRLSEVSLTLPLKRCQYSSMIKDGLVSSFEGRSSSASSFHASLPQAIDGVMSLALCPQVVSQAPQHFRSSEKQATCGGCFARQLSLSVRSFPFTPARPRQYTHMSFQKELLLVLGWCFCLFCFVVAVVFPSQSQPGRIYKGEMAYGTV